MTEKKTDTTVQSTHLFENDYAYITGEGEVFLKTNKLFDEKLLTTIDPGKVDEQVKTLEEEFGNIKNDVEDFLSELEKAGSFDADEARSNFKNLVKSLKKSEAIGDFESLVETAEERFNTITDQKVEDKSSGEEPEKTGDIKEAAGDKKVETKPAAKEEETDSEIEIDKEPVQDEPESDSDEKSVDGDEEKVEGSDASSQKKEDESPEDYYRELAEKAETLIELSDWAHATMEFENLNHQWSEGPDPEGAEIQPYKDKIDSLKDQLEEKKKAHYEEQKKIREQNLDRKKKLLADLKEIVEKEQWTKTKAVAKIKGTWDNIRPVPAEEHEKLEKPFNDLLSTFDDHKVDRLVKQKQQEEDNLTGKLVILEKMEAFLSELGSDSKEWKELDKEFSELAKQFRKIGRVPSDKNHEVWDRFHKAQDTFHSLRFKHDKKYRSDIEKFLSKKKKLIDEAEALIDFDNLPKAARKVNKLHRRWKKVGNLPQKEENELWDRFKAATDAFNDKKSDNIDVLREQEDKNYQKKLTLIEKANEIKDSEEWDKTHKELQRLMDEWKKIGPVPRRKSGKIWKKFKGAMDHFYDRRRDYFKEVKEERKDNLKEKEEVLDKLKELKSHENPIEAVNIAKPLQEEFKKAGYVPIKHKNRMWKEYRETCDVIYDRFRAAKSAAQIVGKENVENYSADDITEIKKKREQAGKLRSQIKSLSSDLIQMKESLSYFKPSKGGSSLLDDVKEKIDKAEEEINQKEEKLQKLEVEIDKKIREN